MEFVFIDGGTDVFHEAKHEMDVVEGGEAEVGELVYFYEVVKVGLRVVLACGAVAMRVYRRRVFFVFRGAEVDAPFVLRRAAAFGGDEDVASSCNSCWGNAVERVDAALDALEDIVDASDAEQVSWTIVELRDDPFKDSVHVCFAVA